MLAVAGEDPGRRVVDPQHQALDAVLRLQGVGPVELAPLVGGQADRLPEPERVEVVDVDVDVADPVVGEVRHERERQVLQRVEAAHRVAGVGEADVLRLEGLADRLRRLGLVDLADVAGVRLLPGQRVEHVPPGDVVLVGRGQRLEDDQPRELRLGLQHVDLVGVGQPGRLEPVGPHRRELGHVVDARRRAPPGPRAPPCCRRSRRARTSGARS